MTTFNNMCVKLNLSTIALLSNVHFLPRPRPRPRPLPAPAPAPPPPPLPSSFGNRFKLLFVGMSSTSRASKFKLSGKM